MGRLLDRRIALAASRAFAGGGPQTTPSERADIGRSIRAACERADAAVRALTGWESAPPTPVPEVVNRRGWVAANLTSLEPLLDLAAERLPMPRAGLPAMRGVVSAQIGLVFGYLSRKVIGQYDLFGGERVLFVGPNVVEIERRAEVDPEDFRLWVALHEVTHRLQFSGTDWLRPHLEALLDRSLSLAGPKTPPIGELVGRVRASIAGGTPVAGLAEIVLTPEQKALLAEAQSLMSAVEGHASYVMDELGRSMISDVAALRRKVEGTRGQPVGPERAFQTAIGLDAKRRQYARGQRFFDDVSRRGGPEAVRLAWRAPETLPRADEFEAVDRWWARVAGKGE